MKKNLSLIKLAAILCLNPVNLLFAQNTPPSPYTGTLINYTRTWVATAPEQTPANLVTRPLTDVKQTTQYYDGFGRTMQMVSKQASPLGNDLVLASTYDIYGREVYKYLP